MKIEIIKIGELTSFIESPLYKNFREIPISRLRALSQAQNPRASEDDVALIFAHEDNKLLSYIGLLPDTTWTEDKAQKVWWNSCWWANTTEKHNASMQLFYLACKISEGKLYFPELTPHTCDLLNRMKNFKTLQCKGVRGYMKLDLSNILPAKRKAFVKIRPILILIDLGINLVYSPKRWIFQKKLEGKKLNYKMINRIDNEATCFIEEHNSHELFRRNKEDMNWIIDNPWITTENGQVNQKYAFSLQAKSFKTILVKTYKDNQMNGFFTLLIRDGNAKLTYCYFKEDSISNFVDVLYKILLDNNISSFLSFDTRIAAFVQENKNPFIFTRQQVKTIAFPTEKTIEPQAIQDGDGDCAFV